MYFDVTPANHAEVVDRIATMVRDAPGPILADGLAWYEQAHAAAVDLARGFGITLRQAAGVLSALSPGIDAELLLANGLDVIGATGAMRAKAQRCLTADPTEVLNPHSGPKTWAFFWNIYAPSLRDHVTIDGRQADIICNRMRPWRAERGIARGGPGTRYESYEFVTEDAARVLRRSRCFRTITAVQVQAVSWMHGKAIERQGTTIYGAPRKQGVFRKGQVYL